MSEFLARHGAHLVVLGGPVVVLAGLFLMLELTRPDRTRRSANLWTWLLALTWAAVATVHLTVIAEHFREAVALGIFFLILSVAQYSYAVTVIRRASTRVLLIGMAASTAVILLWTYTRVVAIPFGIGPREPVETADLTATLLEVGTVVLTALALSSRARVRSTAGYTRSRRSVRGTSPSASTSHSSGTARSDQPRLDASWR